MRTDELTEMEKLIYASAFGAYLGLAGREREPILHDPVAWKESLSRDRMDAACGAEAAVLAYRASVVRMKVTRTKMAPS